MTDTTHIMLDLETWGKYPCCDIRSIGACVFYPETTGDVTMYDERTFYVATENPIDKFAGYSDGIVSLRKYPLIRDPETIKWWIKQSPEAQAAFVNPVDLCDACLQFTEWMIQLTDEPLRTIRLWANGPQLDISILEMVYRAVKLPVPWHYRSPRDFRTIIEAAGMTRDDLVKPTIPHHALHDAIAQAQSVCEAYKRLGLTNG